MIKLKYQQQAAVAWKANAGQINATLITRDQKRIIYKNKLDN